MTETRTIPYMGGEIRMDADDLPDDLVFGVDGTPIRVHIERMAQGAVWIGLDDNQGNHLRAHLSSDTPLRFTVETEGAEEHTLGFDAKGYPRTPGPDFDPTEQ